MRYFRANAAIYGIDPQQIGALGSSAGGQLAAILGTTDRTIDEVNGWIAGSYPLVSSRVEAVVEWFGPVDLLLTLQRTKDPALIRFYYGAAFPSGCSASPLVHYSATSYVTSDDSPAQLQRGVLDNEVPYANSTELTNQLTTVGVPAQLTPVQHAGHGFDPSPPGATISPSLEQIAAGVDGFFDATLKNNPYPEPR